MQTSDSEIEHFTRGSVRLELQARSSDRLILAERPSHLVALQPTRASPALALRLFLI